MMLRTIMEVARRMGGLVTIAVATVGVLYFWADLRDLPSAYGFRWGQFMPDRETVAFILLALAFAWMLWRDFRPIALTYFQRKRLQIIFTDSAARGPSDLCQRAILVDDTQNINEDGERSLWYDPERSKTVDIWHIAVKNTSQNVIHNVNVSVSERGGDILDDTHFIGSLLNVNENATRVTIQPDAWTIFRIAVCSSSTPSILGAVRYDMPQDLVDQFQLKRFFLCLAPSSSDRKWRLINLQPRPDQGATIVINVYSDELPRRTEFLFVQHNVGSEGYSVKKLGFWEQPGLRRYDTDSFSPGYRPDRWKKKEKRRG